MNVTIQDEKLTGFPAKAALGDSPLFPGGPELFGMRFQACPNPLVIALLQSFSNGGIEAFIAFFPGLVGGLFCRYQGWDQLLCPEVFVFGAGSGFAQKVGVAATVTASKGVGLKIRAALDEGIYPTGRKASDQETSQIKLTRAEFQPAWNYKISPK